MRDRKRSTVLIRSLRGLVLAGLTLWSAQAIAQEPENPFTGRVDIRMGQGQFESDQVRQQPRPNR